MRRLNKVLGITLILCVVFVVFALTYSEYVKRESVSHINETTIAAQKIEKDGVLDESGPITGDEQDTNPEQNVLSDDTEYSPEAVSAERVDAENESDLFQGFFSAEELAEEADVDIDERPVSPFGFGPYPEIPADFPEPDIFEILPSLGNSEMAKTLELQKRLIIKKWEEGESLENVGVTGTPDGKVYLIYPDVVYVTWDYYTDEDGVVHKYAGALTGHPDTAHLYEPYLDEGKIPPGFTVYEKPDGAIDAYEYLGLQR